MLHKKLQNIVFQFLDTHRTHVYKTVSNQFICSGNSMSRSIVYSNSNYVVACSYGEVSNYNECMPATVLNKTSTVPCTPMAPGCISLAYLIDLE